MAWSAPPRASSRRGRGYLLSCTRAMSHSRISCSRPAVSKNTARGPSGGGVTVRGVGRKVIGSGRRSISATASQLLAQEHSFPPWVRTPRGYSLHTADRLSSPSSACNPQRPSGRRRGQFPS